MSALLKPLSTADRKNFQQLKETVSIECKLDIVRIKAKYKKLKVAELVASGVGEDAAIKVVESRLEHILLPDDILNFDNAGQVTVKEVLDNPDKYNEQSLADPLEPEKGKCKAKFYANKTTSNPIIHSYIHGGDL